MAGFHPKYFWKHDCYMTPKYVWENIIDYLPKDKVIWECFYGDGKSGEDMRELGLNVIHEPIDFFVENRGDILVSNPPFSKKREVFTRLKMIDKPFIMICPSSMLNTKYIRELFSEGNHLQIIIPKNRIQFIRRKDGVNVLNGRCNFDCFYYCYKMKLPSNIIWLD